MKLAILIVAVLAAGCTQADRATEALSNAGYSDIQIDGYAFFACSEKDTFSTAFKAKGPTGRPVSGAVCSGFLKGQTIRLD